MQGVRVSDQEVLLMCNGVCGSHLIQAMFTGAEAVAW